MRKMTQEEMAELLKMSRRNYCKLENGEIDITLSRLYKMAEILNVDIIELIGISKPDFHNPITDAERELYRQMMTRMEAEIKYLKELIRTLH
jgi:transcriptional regulator with XRE-family HTH domain